MMEFERFIEILERIAPPKLTEEWDHAGLQIAIGAKTVEKVLICLDVTENVISEAEQLGADMIISHHPFIFDGIYSLDAQNPLGKKIKKLIQSNISVYTAHTAYDKSNAGNTVQMARRIGIPGFPLTGSASGEDQDFSLLICTLEVPMNLEELVGMVQTGLSLKSEEIRVVRGNSGTIHKIGLCAGSGGDFLLDILQEGCQAYITGDVKYHLAMEAKEAKLTLIDPGHFGSEKFFAEDFGKLLVNYAGMEIQVFQSKNDHNPFDT